MFEDLYDEMSLLFSWRWPIAEGQITAVDVERNSHREIKQVAVAYKFSIGEDGPYVGETFWKPVFNQKENAIRAKRLLRPGHAVQVHYRPDDPTVNTLAGSVRRLLRNQ